MTAPSLMTLRCAITLALAGTVAPLAAAQPTSASLRFEHLATVEHMGRIDVNPVTGTIAVGTTGPGDGSAHPIRLVDTAGTVTPFGDAITDPDAVVWDVRGVFAQPGSVLVGGVGGIFALNAAGQASLLFEPGADFANPETMAISPAGELLIADYNNNRVQMADGLGRFATIAASHSPVSQVAVSPFTGEILYGDQDGNVSDIDFTGRLLSNGTGTHLSGLAFGDGSARWGHDAYAVDAATGDLLRFTGQASTVIASGLFDGAAGSGLFGAGIGFLPGGDMVVGVPATDTLWRVVPAPGTAALLALGGLTAIRRRR